jgi:hypothetical protein
VVPERKARTDRESRGPEALRQWPSRPRALLDQCSEPVGGRRSRSHREWSPRSPELPVGSHTSCRPAAYRSLNPYACEPRVRRHRVDLRGPLPAGKCRKASSYLHRSFVSFISPRTN